jgi:hypothetical protein
MYTLYLKLDGPRDGSYPPPPPPWLSERYHPRYLPKHYAARPQRNVHHVVTVRALPGRLSGLSVP